MLEFTARYDFIDCPTPEEHRMAYWEWGDPNNREVLICVHGLTLNGRSFENLATVLASHYRVICPDLVGRGNSDWLTEPKNYMWPTYFADLVYFLQQLNLHQVDWLGTSLGGIMGMFMAAQFPQQIKKLVLNDVGAFLSQKSLEKIAKYLLFCPKEFSNLELAENNLRSIYAPFGDLTDEQWKQLLNILIVPDSDAGYRWHYDPQLAAPFAEQNGITSKDIELWDTWSKVTCPTLLIHGENSELLLAETIEKMQQDHSNLEVVHLPNIGHAPALMAEDQILLIQNWLLN